MKYLILFLFLSAFLRTTPQNQNIIEIRGVVRDSANNEPIELTNIYLLNNSSVGVISNQEGYFNLKIDGADTIVFSHIGYNTATFYPIESKAFVEIKLAKKPIKLNEVVIKPVDAISIMNKVNSNLKNNYYLKSIYYKLFVRVWETTNNNLDVVEEYILNLYQKFPIPKFKIIKGRAKPFSEKATKEFKERKLYNIIDVYTDYHILFSSDFLKQNKFENYKYTYLGLVKIDSYTCYHIICESKKSNEVIHLYVEQNSYGLARIEVFSKNEKYTAESKHIVNFIKIDKQWYLKSSSYLYIPKNQLNKKIERICMYSVIDNESRKDYQNLRKTAETQLNLYKSEFDDDFWENNNFVPIPKYIKEQMK
ncbi:MAG: hypothetical protein PWP52_1882 [Bacteroidales bacterium]|nr:hypothetical protein [Bacteroidales bacterium]